MIKNVARLKTISCVIQLTQSSTVGALVVSEDFRAVGNCASLHLLPICMVISGFLCNQKRKFATTEIALGKIFFASWI